MKKKYLPLLFVLSSCLFISSCSKTNEFSKDDEYIYNLQVFSSSVLNSYETCEYVGKKIENIWHDSMYEEMDTSSLQYTFDEVSNEYRSIDEAILKYESSDEFSNYKGTIETDKEMLLDLYTEINSYPDKYSSEKEYVKNIYDKYSSYNSSILYPSGSYTDYSSLVYSSKDIKNLCETLGSIIPEYSKKNYIFTNKNLYISFYYGIRNGSFTGKLENGLAVGECEFSAENTDGTSWNYKGSFLDGHFNGKGKSTWSDGSSYDGEYKDDLENGAGTYTDSEGNIMSGSFKDGKYIQN